MPDSIQDYGQQFEKLPENLVTALKSLTQHVLGLEKYPRRQEVQLARLQRFYERGDQHIYWNSRTFMFTQAVGGATVQTDDSSVDMPHYVNDYNIYGPYERSLVAVLSQNPPGVNFEPDDPSNAVDIAAAKAAEKFRHYVDRCNPRKNLQSDITRLFCTDGRVILYTRTEPGDGRFGYDDQGNPRSGELITAHGVLESKVPITKGEMDDWPYAVLSDEIDINMAKEEYEFAASNIVANEGNLGESQYERYARLGVLQGTKAMIQAGDAYKHLVTRHRVWLRPAMFRQVPEADRVQLKEIFPNGCFVIFTGGAYCGAAAESMDDHLSVGHPLPGDGQNRQSLLKALVPIQDTFNDLMNLSKEIYDYCIPSTWVDSNAVDADALREQISEPGAYHSFTAPNGKTGPDCFYTEQLGTVPSDMMQALQNLQGQLAQFVTGALPALFGGNMEDQKTASGYAMAREQAMGQMGLPWGALQEMMARAYQQAVKCRAESDPDSTITVKVPDTKGESIESIVVRELAEGSFHCKPDTDSSFPETTAGMRAAFMQLMAQAAQNPLLAEVMWLPENQELGKQLMGLEDLELPGADARDKQLEEIDELLKTAPIPPDPMEVEQAQEMAGAMVGLNAHGIPTPPPQPPPGPKPSVPVDPDFDLHQYEFEVCHDWLNSPDRRKQEAEGNLAGVENVKLHALEHKKFMVMQQAPMPMPGGGAPEPSAPPPLGAPQAPPIGGNAAGLV
jgi:hypothetical protein